jgi:16S rRNA (cytidine1402-2'-O)-methyltransferase
MQTPGLYIVATPIGNLGDMTVRAIETLKSVAVIACEDTRTSGVLCQHYGIPTKRIAYHEHNADLVRPEILRRIQEGQAVALISDAGTPLISDPGYKLVCEARALGLYVTSLPGACSIPVALTLGGLPTDAFYYAGFPPSKASARQQALEALTAIQATLVFLESPHRLGVSLAAMAEVFGDRQARIVREMSKKFEEVIEGSLAELASRFCDTSVKGEIVLLIAPPAPPAPATEETITHALHKALQTLSVKQAAAQVAADFGLPRTQVYQQALKLKHGE